MKGSEIIGALRSFDTRSILFMAAKAGAAAAGEFGDVVAVDAHVGKHTVVHTQQVGIGAAIFSAATHPGEDVHFGYP